MSISNPDLNIVGLSNSSNNSQNDKKIIAIIGVVVLVLGVLAGVFLVKQQQDLREKAAILSCSKPETEECPVINDATHLRNCHPPESDNSPQEIICSVSGQVGFCGTKCFICNAPNTDWVETDASKCQATATPTSQPKTCANLFSDNFDGTSINTANWEKVGDVKLESGKLVVKRDEAGTSAQGDAVYTKDPLTGDFTVEVDIPEIVKTGNGGGNATIFIFADGGDTNKLAVIRGLQQGKYILSSLIGGGNPTKIDLANGPVTIKVERKTGKLSVYYKTSGDYILLVNFTKSITSDVQSIQLHAGNTGPDSSTTVKYDNFKIYCPDMPQPTATATSTSNATATPTSTSRATATTTTTATSTSRATARATSTSSNNTGTPAPIPETGANWPTMLGAGIGVIMIMVSFALAL